MKTIGFALTGLSMLMLAACGSDKKAETDTAAENPDAIVMDTTVAAPSEDATVGVEMATPDNDTNGVIAGGVEEEKVEMK
ncbi:MAG: hypothetical protein NC097_01925 [Clostridium sp.]|nr:hypothetical protein [Prevotella sp.]MCM1428537.1 hypothetical protein [Clostridium sp.]MCM1474985.1 hypothetical protein [Muribaculaceae bacterium]